jgi:membrane protein DedA with SNARE-associated domain
MHSLLLSSLGEFRWLGYLVVFLGVMVEGDVVLFTAFFLARSNLFDLGDLVFFALAGSIIGDLGWYTLGRRPVHFLRWLYPWVERLTKPFDSHLSKRFFHTTLVSKFTYGLHHPILIRAGMIKVPLKHFIERDLVAIVLWIAAVGSLGYFSGYSFSLVRHYLQYAEVALLFALIIFYFIFHFISRWSRREL